MKWKSLSCVWLFVTPWTVAHQAPLPIGFSRQEYWSRLPFPFPGDLPNPETEPRCPALQSHSLPYELPGKTRFNEIYYYTPDFISFFLHFLIWLLENVGFTVRGFHSILRNILNLTLAWMSFLRQTGSQWCVLPLGTAASHPVDLDLTFTVHSPPDS